MLAKHVRSSVVLGVITVALAGACTHDEPLSPSDGPSGRAPSAVQAALWDTLSVPLGVTAVLGNAGLTVTFADVPSDSRCPTRPEEGFACFWEGSAEVALVVSGAGFSERIVLQSRLLEPRSVTFGDFVLELLALDPEPIAEVLDPRTTPYVATLLVRPR